MSLPSVRQELDLDNMDSRASWPKRIKKKVVDLATKAESNLIAYNGATACYRQKRDYIPLPQTTSTVCIQDPLQHLEKYQLTIVLARSGCLYVAEINVVVVVVIVRLFLNSQYCHISCQPALPVVKIVNDHQHQH